MAAVVVPDDVPTILPESFPIPETQFKEKKIRYDDRFASHKAWSGKLSSYSNLVDDLFGNQSHCFPATETALSNIIAAIWKNLTLPPLIVTQFESYRWRLRSRRSGYCVRLDIQGRNWRWSILAGGRKARSPCDVASPNSLMWFDSNEKLRCFGDADRKKFKEMFFLCKHYTDLSLIEVDEVHRFYSEGNRLAVTPRRVSPESPLLKVIRIEIICEHDGCIGGLLILFPIYLPYHWLSSIHQRFELLNSLVTGSDRDLVAQIHVQAIHFIMNPTKTAALDENKFLEFVGKPIMTETETRVIKLYKLILNSLLSWQQWHRRALHSGDWLNQPIDFIFAVYIILTSKDKKIQAEPCDFIVDYRRTIREEFKKNRTCDEVPDGLAVE
ncbi:hypothetical protein BDK51DRAFT_26098 [Blyttiomyces helicus]|uniref:Uncharacterized protein n=1 Tax=Blyttiomyces helicus TaxID=388810 RepID=A0A4P9WAB2_9FUNG|nr:hypothetical protein BDK51DRAFT_26098 [Blyttiomyces helicus]|eukprot:RKO88485.1 hypothetical protein BDK51DRAFT_26098 [Blyttiomyces helicus]